MDMVMPGKDVPRHVRMGLAVFTVGHEGDRAIPCMLENICPVLRLEEVRVAIVDVKVDMVSFLLATLQDPCFSTVVMRNPERSCLSTKEVPRVVVNLLFPSTMADLDVILVLQRLRTTRLGGDMFYGLKSMYGAEDAMVLEVGSVHSLHHYWTLCSQLVTILKNKVLVYSDAAADAWTSAMDLVLANDAADSLARLKWKTSKFGGRTIATPTATTTALAASRRGGNRRVSLLDHATTITLQGEVGREDGEALVKLMSHVVASTGLGLRPAASPHEPTVGEFVHMASVDAAAQPGRLKLLLRDAAEVRKVYAALHGQTVQAGQDYVGIAINNYVVDAKSVPGNGLRRRA